MYLLLRADQKLKQNHEDVLLPAHPQELYLSVKDLGLTLSQKLNSPVAHPVSKQLSTLLRHGHLLEKMMGIIDLEAPRLAWYKQKTWKKHQDTVYWVDIQLAQKKGFKFYQTRSNSIILYDTLPVYCIRWDLEKSYTRKYMRHLDLLQRFPSKIIGVVKTPDKTNQDQKPNY